MEGAPSLEQRLVSLARHQQRVLYWAGHAGGQEEVTPKTERKSLKKVISEHKKGVLSLLPSELHPLCASKAALHLSISKRITALDSLLLPNPVRDSIRDDVCDCEQVFHAVRSLYESRFDMRGFGTMVGFPGMGKTYLLRLLLTSQAASADESSPSAPDIAAAPAAASFDSTAPSTAQSSPTFAEGAASPVQEAPSPAQAATAAAEAAPSPSPAALAPSREPSSTVAVVSAPSPSSAPPAPAVPAPATAGDAKVLSWWRSLPVFVISFNGVTMASSEDLLLAEYNETLPGMVHLLHSEMLMKTDGGPKVSPFRTVILLSCEVAS